VIILNERIKIEKKSAVQIISSGEADGLGEKNPYFCFIFCLISLAISVALIFLSIS
jgi:hypothetical protein